MCFYWLRDKFMYINASSNDVVFCNRGPGSLQGVYFMEVVMEHIAEALGKDPMEIKMMNLYQQGQVS